MILYTIGFTKKSAEAFFELLKAYQIELLIDVRLNNRSQLAGFTKGADIQYFLRELCNAQYLHCEEYAPTKALLSSYHAGKTSWAEYETEFDHILESRGDYKTFPQKYSEFSRICLLCSEPTPEQCHRRLVAEKIKQANHDIDIVHL